MTDQQRQVNKWVVALTVMLPTLIEIIDTSIVNVSLDHIRGSLSGGINEATWAISSYLLSDAIVIPMSEWLARLLGRKRYQIGSIVILPIFLQTLMGYTSYQAVLVLVFLMRTPPEEGAALAKGGG